jgi:hypothetical protein
MRTAAPVVRLEPRSVNRPRSLALTRLTHSGRGPPSRMSWATGRASHERWNRRLHGSVRRPRVHRAAASSGETVRTSSAVVKLVALVVVAGGELTAGAAIEAGLAHLTARSAVGVGLAASSRRWRAAIAGLAELLQRGHLRSPPPRPNSSPPATGPVIAGWALAVAGGGRNDFAKRTAAEMCVGNSFNSLNALEKSPLRTSGERVQS